MGIASLNTILRKAVLPGTVADLIRESRRRFRLSRTRSAPTGKHHASRRIVGAGPAREIARRARSYREWCGWGGVGADLIRESRRRFRLSRTRSAPTGKHHASRRIVGAGPAREIARRARSYREWCGWSGVGADLIRESRRRFRLSRTRSAPTGKHHASRRIVGAGPARDFARRARSYREWCGWGGVADLVRDSNFQRNSRAHRNAPSEGRAKPVLRRSCDMDVARAPRATGTYPRGGPPWRGSS
ncbi:hypothetical protein PcP3B5_39370 [Pseudomonas citronellolis]|nr:hypothetical protein PcP3B5_39370 [Pseudomonas citronellolis]